MSRIVKSGLRHGSTRRTKRATNVIEFVDKPTLPRWKGKSLAAHRAQKGLKLNELARLVGATRGLVNKWENDRSAPSAEYLAALGVIFGVSPIAFFVGIDEYQSDVLRLRPLTEPWMLDAERIARDRSNERIRKRAASGAPPMPEPQERPRPRSRPSVRKPDDDQSK